MDLQCCRLRQMTGREEAEHTCKFVRAGGWVWEGGCYCKAWWGVGGGSCCYCKALR